MAPILHQITFTDYDATAACHGKPCLIVLHTSYCFSYRLSVQKGLVRPIILLQDAALNIVSVHVQTMPQFKHLSSSHDPMCQRRSLDPTASLIQKFNRLAIENFAQKVVSECDL